MIVVIIIIAINFPQESNSQTHNSFSKNLPRKRYELFFEPSTSFQVLTSIKKEPKQLKVVKIKKINCSFQYFLVIVNQFNLSGRGGFFGSIYNYFRNRFLK